ncbi:MAG: DUF1858 domain-containing protein [Clostridiaceae bacterium]|nr:DUF1858 domain-containing protein [Clostridiaceae bacterium]
MSSDCVKSDRLITGDMLIMDVIRRDTGCAPIFFANGLQCLGCAMAHHETLERACTVHGLNIEKLLDQLNEYFAVTAAPIDDCAGCAGCDPDNN